MGLRTCSLFQTVSAAMRSFLLIVFLSLFVSPVMADASPDSVDFRLDAHRWEHRLLFVFAPSDSADALAVQEDRFEGHDAGFRDRDLLLLTITGDETGTLREAPGTDARPLTEAAVGRLYDHFGVPADAFRVLLVGKDGTEKRRDAEPVTVRSVFDTIDAMPMRQREMRESSDEGR
jgi:hypothetical protein